MKYMEIIMAHIRNRCRRYNALGRYAYSILMSKVQRTLRKADWNATIYLSKHLVLKI